MDFEGFMYLDVENPLTAWNTYRGVLISQSYIQEDATLAAPALSMTMTKMFMDRNWNRLQFEFELEKVRVKNFGTSVSRLNCLYVFDEPESALAAADDERWGGHIHQENLTDIGVSAIDHSRLDANWISWMLQMYYNNDSAWFSGISPYWSGEMCTYFDKPIWEVLINGSIAIWGTTLRERAYQITKQYSPLTVGLLEQSRLAAHLGSGLGHLSAFVINENEKSIMKFYINMKDAHNKIYTDRLATYMKENPHAVNFRALEAGGDKFGLPNLRACELFARGVIHGGGVQTIDILAPHMLLERG